MPFYLDCMYVDTFRHSFSVICITSIFLSDIHPRTKEYWFYSVTKSQKNAKKEIPDKWKETFDQKTVTAGKYLLEIA